MAVEKEGKNLGGGGAEFDWLARGDRGLLRDAPNLGVFERVFWVVLDLPRDARPAPGLVDGIEHCADRIGEQRRTGFFGLEFLMFEALPALEHVVVPGAAGDVLVQ